MFSEFDLVIGLRLRLLGKAVKEAGPEACLEAWYEDKIG